MVLYLFGIVATPVSVLVVGDTDLLVFSVNMSRLEQAITCLVIVVSLTVLVYISYYMGADSMYSYYRRLMSAFIVRMLGLLLAGN